MSVQAVELLYGRGTLTLTLPDNAEATIINKPPFPEAASAAEVFAQAMADPVGCESLDRLCGGCNTACILICDITRPVPNHVFLQPMIRTMMENGIAAENITVLIATGASVLSDSTAARRTTRPRESSSTPSHCCGPTVRYRSR